MPTPTELVTYTTLEQDGESSDSTFSTWVPAATSLSPGLGRMLGFIFNPAPSDAARPASITLTPTGTGFPIVTLTQEVYGIFETTPDVFSDSNLATRAATRTSRTLLSSATGSYALGGMLVGDTPFTFNLGQRFTDDTWAEDATLADNLQRWWAAHQARADWNGRFAITLSDPGSAVSSSAIYYSSATGSGATLPSITLLEWRLHSGHMEGKLGRHKATYCPRMGTPMMTDELIEDDYLPGLYVHPDSWEPEDRVGQDINIPSTERDDDERQGVDG